MRMEAIGKMVAMVRDISAANGQHVLEAKGSRGLLLAIDYKKPILRKHSLIRISSIAFRTTGRQCSSVTFHAEGEIATSGLTFNLTSVGGAGDMRVDCLRLSVALNKCPQEIRDCSFISVWSIIVRKIQLQWRSADLISQ